MTKRFDIAGISDDVDTCECCGRDNLKRTVALRDLDTGEVEFFGTTCAAHLLKMKATDLRSDARQVQRWKDEAARKARMEQARKDAAPWFRFLRESTDATEVADQIRELGGFAAARSKFAAWKI